jgi:regulator of sirC expression with transglutaminase-like and TPR domain
MPTTDDIQEYRSLVKLLDDPDEAVYQLIRTEIVQRGQSILPCLEDALEGADPLMQERITMITSEIQFGQTCQQMAKWVAFSSSNLLSGVLIVSKYQFPNLKEEPIIRRLGHIIQDIYLRIKDNMNPVEKIQVINAVLYDDYEFFGNKKDYQSPASYHLNVVMDTGKGNHLSLGILYLLVARSLGIPVSGIILGEYFFIAYQEDDKTQFYINPFSKGNILTMNELLFFLKLADVDLPPDGIKPASHPDIVRQLIISLMGAYRKLGKEEKAGDLETLLGILG